MGSQRGLQLGLRVSHKAVREDTRTTNRRLVLQLLFNGDDMSRADLARRTGLTHATVSALAAGLSEEGLVEEAGTRRDDAQVGKPPTMLRLCQDARHVVAVDLSDPTTMRAAVIDLAGVVMTEANLPVEGATGAAAVDRMKALIRLALDHTSAPILGIGIGTPGVVSPDGSVLEASNFAWHDIPLREQLEETLGLPVHVSNDANAAAIAEYTRGGHECSNLAVVKMGSGIGAGFVLNGQLYQGQHSGAGEIGHLVVDADGPDCRCGHRGCLEAFVSAPRIIDALAANGADATSVLEDAAERLGIALAAIVAILDIDHVLVSGPRDLLGDDFCDVATDHLRNRCLAATARSVSVRYSALGDDAVLLGAASLVLSQELGVA
jgi:predicted NBD/HSP70 family sugar kinase